MVRTELQLEPVGRLRRRTRHDAGVVDEDVQHRVAREEAFREGADVLQRAELELLDLDVPIARRGANRGRHRFALRHVAGGEDHVGTSPGQDARRLLAQSARPAGDQRHLAAQVDAVRDLACGGLVAERRRVTHGDPPLDGVCEPTSAMTPSEPSAEAVFVARGLTKVYRMSEVEAWQGET